MKLRIFAFFLSSIFYTAIAFAKEIDQRPLPRSAKTSAQLEVLFRSKRGLANFRENIGGIPRVDTNQLGTNLPAGLTKESIVRLIAPNEDISLLSLVGAKAFPYRLNSYVVIACFAQDKEDLSEYKGWCGQTFFGGKTDVYLGLIEYENSRLKLIASSIKKVKIEAVSNNSNLYQASRRPLIPEGYVEFDFAPYKINNTQTAFGLRLGWEESYSGGNAYFESLAVFMIDKDRIVNILSEPMYFYQNIAGAWNKDKSRQHDLYEGENVIIVLPTQTNGYYDLQIKSLDSKWQKVFSWNNSQKRYLPISVR
jgi:hypothetical protein